MQRIWGGGAGLDVRETKKVFLSAIKEYMSAGDVGEVRRTLHDLAVPHYHHEFVYLTIQTCFENREKFEALMELLKALIETLDVNRTQKFMGLKRVAMDLADQSLLDYPEAKDMYIRRSIGAPPTAGSQKGAGMVSLSWSSRRARRLDGAASLGKRVQVDVPFHDRRVF